MAELIFYKGNDQITVTPSDDICYLYRIGSGQVEGGDFIDLNDELFRAFSCDPPSGVSIVLQYDFNVDLSCSLKLINISHFSFKLSFISL